MKFMNKTFSISIIYYMILFALNARAADLIKILMEKPKVLYDFDCERYSTILKNYNPNSNITTTDTGNIFADVDVQFNCIQSNPYVESGDRVIDNYFELVIEQFRNGTCDMAIVDGDLLFSDIAFISSSYTQEKFKGRLFYQLYQELDEFVKNDNYLSSNFDQEIINKAFYNDHIYGLPYSFDFDLLYYSAVENQNYKLDTFDDFLLYSEETKKAGKNIISIPLGDNDELFNTFVEYQVGKGNNTIANNYLEEDFYKSFKNFIEKSNLIEQLDKQQVDAYDSHIKDKDVFFKGKASHYNSLLHYDPNHQFRLLPAHNTVAKTKYLIINKSSKYTKKRLYEVAQKLVSNKIQYLRFDTFGEIPAFSLSQKGSDEFVKAFCSNNIELCTAIENLETIKIEDLFKSQYGASYLEVKLLLPDLIRNYLKSNEPEAVDNIRNVFDNIFNLALGRDDKNSKTVFLALHIITLIFTLSLILFLVMVWKYRKHPYLISYSPDFCILVIISVIMNVANPAIKVHINSLEICKFNVMYETINTCFLIFPLLATTYRIFLIYRNTSNVSYGNKLKNRNLFIFVIVATALICLYSYIMIVLRCTHYLLSHGNIGNFRTPLCQYEGDGKFYEDILRYFNRALIVLLIVLVVITGKESKKFGEFKYIFILVFVFFIENCSAILLNRFSSKGSFMGYMVTLLVYLIGYSICVYVLVGKRLIYIIKHRISSLSNNTNNGSSSNYASSTNYNSGNYNMNYGSNFSNFNTTNFSTNSLNNNRTIVKQLKCNNSSGGGFRLMDRSVKSDFY